MDAEEAIPNENPDISDLEQKIIRQVEYYFGDYNLARDKFLRERVKLDDGWVPLEILVKFNRLKTLTEDFTVISSAIKKSPNQLLEVDEENTKIRRLLNKPVPIDLKAFKDEIDERSLYVKGFKADTTLDELLDFFKPHKPDSITMRRRYRQAKKPFKGSVFVAFQTKDDAEKFLNLKDIKYNGTELLKEKKKAYLERKDVFFQQILEEKEKKRQKKIEALAEAENSHKIDVKITEGCLLKIDGLGKDTYREDIKEELAPYGTIVFIDYSKGKPSAIVRFDTPIAQSVFERAVKEGTNTMEICSEEVSLSVVTGEEEIEYWNNYAKYKHLANLRHQEEKNNKKGRFTKKNRGKRKHPEENKNGDANSESTEKSSETAENNKETEDTKPQNKKAKTESETEKLETEDIEPQTKKAKTESEAEIPVASSENGSVTTE